jgi:hypothetical protein
MMYALCGFLALMSHAMDVLACVGFGDVARWRNEDEVHGQRGSVLVCGRRPNAACHLALSTNFHPALVPQAHVPLALASANDDPRIR